MKVRFTALHSATDDEQIRKIGREAYARGMPRTANPWLLVRYARLWDEGWYDARDGYLSRMENDAGRA